MNDFNSNIEKVTGDFGRGNDQQQIKNKDIVDSFFFLMQKKEVR